MKRSNLTGTCLVICLALSITISGCGLIDSMFGDSDSDNEDLGLMSITPTEGLANEILVVSITGQALSNDVSPNLVVRLINGPTIVTGVDVNVITGGQVTAQFTLPQTQTSMVMDVAASDDDGDEGSLTQVFTVNQFETLTAAKTVPVTIDISGGDVSYVFSRSEICDATALDRDVTFTLVDGNPAITVTTGGSGGIYPYPTPFSSLGAASGLEARLSWYARAGDPGLTRQLVAGEYYGLLSVGDVDGFIVLYIDAVDAGADTATVNFMIVRMIERE